jgi:hypothetical protein
MIQVDNLSDDALQRTSVRLEDGSVAVLNLNYLYSLQRWIMDVTYGDFIVRGIGLGVHLNLLRQFKNKINFGVACSAVGAIDPFDIDDFSNGRAALFVLNETEAAGFEATFFGAEA